MSGTRPDVLDSLSRSQLLVAGLALVVALAGGVFFVQSMVLQSGTGEDVEPIYDTPVTSQNVSDGHLSAIESAGSVTYTRQQEIVSAGVPFQNTTTTERYDLSAGSKYVVKSVEQAELAGYSTSDSSYIRLKQGNGNVSYSQGQEYGKVNSPLALALDTHRPDNLGFGVLDATNLTYRKQKSVDGTTVFVYGANGSSKFQRERLPGGFDALTTAWLRLEVTESGMISRYEYHFEDTNGDIDKRVFRLRASEAGTTDVSSPPWLSEAKASTSS